MAREPKQCFWKFWCLNVQRYVKNLNDIQPEEIRAAIADYFNEDCKRKKSKPHGGSRK